MKKVYMLPTVETAKKDYTTSINQIVLRLEPLLKEHGYELVSNRNEADIIAAHAGQTFGQNEGIDVAHCHGLYPTGKQGAQKVHYGINQNVIRHIWQAKAVTVPSSWVADILRREMNIEPYIVPWAIERKEWQGAHENKQYTLWNKTRASFVCDPTPLLELAKAYPNNPFVTTFSGAESVPDNVDVIGRQTFEVMQETIKNCGVYLATTKETFGIGILEAMASGKPVLGYEWGAIPDIVQHGHSGFLAKPGDIDGLIEGLKWLWTHYQDVSRNARKAATNDFYTWQRVAKQFARVYDLVYAQKMAKTPYDVCIVIPAHNYGHYITETINSAMNQNFTGRYEVIVVDDNSTDLTPEIVSDLQKAYADSPVPLRYIRNEVNLHVAETRNKGIRSSVAPFIVCLDADDMLGSPDFLQVHYDYMSVNPHVGIGYAGLAAFTDDSPNMLKKSAFPGEFDMSKQLGGVNQVPTCCMFRRDAFERAGGYRKYQSPAEDAALWTAITVLGFQAKKISDEYLFFYRFHDKSLSNDVRMGYTHEPYWLRQWHTTIGTKPYIASIQNIDNKLSHPVIDFDTPKISIIIPVGAGHELNVIRALDSVQGQTFLEWECIVVNDTGAAFNIPHKWVKRVDFSDGKQGAGVARNAGLDLARGDFVVFLDADDMLLPDFLAETLKAWQKTGRYIYTDWLGQNGRDTSESQAGDYSQTDIIRKSSIHAITALIPTQWAKAVGGFDETLAAWEDTDFFMKLAISGYCGARLARTLFVYNYSSGKRREYGLKHKPELVQEIHGRYGQYITGNEPMCKCNEILKNKPDLSAAVANDEMIRVELISGAIARSTVIGGATKQHYGSRKVGDIFYIYKEDIDPRRFKPVAMVSTDLKETVIPESVR